MASKNSTEKCDTQIKGGTAQQTPHKLAQKLQLNLERDILRLFQDSVYCDIKFIIHSSSLLTHSCILRARASKFYKFIFAELEVLEENGISVFNIYNASFGYLQKFLENIYTNYHSFHAEDKIIKHLKETKYHSLENIESEKPSISSAKTPETDLFFTPKCSPSELQKPFAPSKLKISENDVASYYKITVDDIPVDEKLDGIKLKSAREENLLEKELAEQDELFSSFQTILSKKNKNKPNSFFFGTSSQSAKKTKPKFNRKFDSNLLLLENHDKNKYISPHWKPDSVIDRQYQRNKYLSGVKTAKKNFSNSKPQEKVDLGIYLEDPTNSVSSDMDVSTTGGDSGLDFSIICQQETSPKENTMSETSGVDLTEAAINEDIPNDETISTKQSSGSSVSSEPGTWDANDDYKVKLSSNTCNVEASAVCDIQANSCKDASNKNQLNEDEITRLDEMEKNMRECEVFLFMERRASGEESRKDSSMMDNIVPGSLDNTETSPSQRPYQYAKEKEVSNPEEFLQGEIDHRENFDEENYYNYSYCIGKNSDDVISPEVKNYESLDANEFLNQGVADDTMSTNSDFFAPSDILRNVQETKTPPCTPKKLKKEEPDITESNKTAQESNSRNWENNNSTGVSNFFIDASSLLDEDEIISPPISLINFKSIQSLEDNEASKSNNKNNNNNNNLVEEPKIVSKKIVSNFYIPDSSDDISFQKESEKRQGDIIFKNSIPHYSKHEVEENHNLDLSERLRGGSDVEDESEQVPSANIEFSLPHTLVDKQNTEECGYLVESDYLQPHQFSLESYSEYSNDYVDSAKDLVSETRENYTECKDILSSSECYESPTLKRKNESAPILSGGMDLVEEEEKVQKTTSHLHGEAWIVTFDNDNKTKNNLESRKESEDNINLKSVCTNQSREGRQPRRREPSVEFYVDKKCDETNSVKPESKAYSIEKSNSAGYFLDFGKDSGDEIIQQPVESKSEKKNIFSMFIGMHDDSNPISLKKFKPTFEREGTFDKSTEETSMCQKDNPENDKTEDRKKPFYMFIESDSPSVRRKLMPRKLNKSSAEAKSNETIPKKNYLRTQSYTVQQNSEEEVQSEIKTDFDCSSSDNSLLYSEGNFKVSYPVRGKLPLTANRFRNIDNNRESRMTAWTETKQPNVSTVPSESWLKTRDIQVNYREKNKEHRSGVYHLKDSTFAMDGCKDKYSDKCKNKPPERDSGVILSDKGDDSFVKLSDLDSSDTLIGKQITETRLSQSISEVRDGKVFVDDENTLSKSLGSEGSKTNSKTTALYAKKVNRSLIRLFPNLNAESLARIGRRDEAEAQASENSEVSSSMQSSVEPSGLEISTSETDVSTYAGTTSRLGEDLLKMFLEEISPDIVIDVNGRRIKAHKCVLSSRCQYFAALLSGGWVESAGNVISLQGFSYNAVHFALRHIYSGESRIPESLSIVELATLADMLCLDGLQEIISCNLKVKYCHSFHVPCSVCSVGVIDCLPVAAAYGLDDLYRKCLRWITKYFVKIWPTKSFGSLPKELLEKCYQHYVVHMTVDNVLDTIVSIDKLRGSLPNVRWAESVSRLVNKLHDATVRYIAEHFSSVLTSDNFLALGKEEGWNVSRLEDSLIEAVRYLPPEQACWSHARLHRILSVATGPDPPPEMDWNENFLKLLQLIAELVENSLIKQAPRAAKSKAWRQMEPELRSKIQVAACLVLPDQEQSSGGRRSNFVKKETGPINSSQTAKNRNFEIRQIKLAMSQQTNNRNPITNRPLSLQIDQRSKKDSRFIPLRPSVSTSSVRKTEPPIQSIRKTQSRSHILGNTSSSEPKKTINPRYSGVKSRYLEPKSPLRSSLDKQAADSNTRRNFRNISSSDSSRNCSPALRSSNSRSSIPQAKRLNFEISKQPTTTVLKSGSTTALDSKRDRRFSSNRSDTLTVKTLSRLTKEQNMSMDSLCTDSLISEKDATVHSRRGKENLEERIKSGNPFSKSSSNSPVSKRHSSGSWSSTASKTSAARKLIKPPNDSKSNPPKRFTPGKVPNQNISSSILCKSNVSSPRTTTATRNQRNVGKVDMNLVNGNTNRKKNDVDSENNKKNLKDMQPLAVERSGTFLKDEPTILKKPEVGSKV